MDPPRGPVDRPQGRPRGRPRKEVNTAVPATNKPANIPNTTSRFPGTPQEAAHRALAQQDRNQAQTAPQKVALSDVLRSTETLISSAAPGIDEALSGYGSPGSFDVPSSFAAQGIHGVPSDYGVPSNSGTLTSYGTPTNLEVPSSLEVPSGYGIPSNSGPLTSYGASINYGVPVNYGVQANYGVPVNHGVPVNYGVPVNHGAPSGFVALSGFAVPSNSGFSGFGARFGNVDMDGNRKVPFFVWTVTPAPVVIGYRADIIMDMAYADFPIVKTEKELEATGVDLTNNRAEGSVTLQHLSMLAFLKGVEGEDPSNEGRMYAIAILKTRDAMQILVDKRAELAAEAAAKAKKAKGKFAGGSTASRKKRKQSKVAGAVEPKVDQQPTGPQIQNIMASIKKPPLELEDFGWLFAGEVFTLHDQNLITTLNEDQTRRLVAWVKTFVARNSTVPAGREEISDALTKLAEENTKVDTISRAVAPGMMG